MLNIIMGLLGDAPGGQQARACTSGDVLLKLKDQGCTLEEIYGALEWLESFARPQYVARGDRSSFQLRVYSFEEQQKISAEAQGYLLQLVDHGLLSHGQKECVIDSIMCIEVDVITMPQVKWVARMIILAQSESPWKKAVALDLAQVSNNKRILH